MIHYRLVGEEDWWRVKSSLVVGHDGGLVHWTEVVHELVIVVERKEEG